MTPRTRPRALRRLAAFLVLVLAGTTLTTGPASAIGGGQAVPPSSYTFTARLQIGSLHACSGALVSPNWVLTAKSCFTEGNAQPLRAQAPPPLPTTATVGRGDLKESGGWRVGVVELVPHPDRDLVLAGLDVWAHNVRPIPIAATPAEPGEKLRVTGYGRTTTEWAPDTAHTTTVTAGAATGTTLAVTPDGEATGICKGDAGGPTFRERDGVTELVGVHHTSGQRGCLDAGENTTAGATETRVDGLAGWIASATDRTRIQAADNRWWTTGTAGYPCYDATGTRLRWTADGGLGVQDWANQVRGMTTRVQGDTLHFHSDGNLVIWRGGQAVWWTGTGGHPGARLECGDGGAAIIDGTTVLWQSGTSPTLYATANLTYRGWNTYQTPLCVSPDNRKRLYVWGTTLFNSNGWLSLKPPADALTRFGSNGELAIRANGTETALWSTKTAGHPNARIVCLNDGNVGVVDGSTVLWDAFSHPTGELVSGVQSDRCVDVNGANGSETLLWTCNIASDYGWTFNPDKSIQTTRASNMCMDVRSGGTANGTVVQVWTCRTGHANQIWERLANGSLRNPKSGKCLDVPNGKTETGTVLQLYTCNGTAAQRWTLRVRNTQTPSLTAARPRDRTPAAPPPKAPRAS
ncbi:MAG: ricin-type beta-trefoil lectin domain protein [Spirillospora sp.]